MRTPSAPVLGVLAGLVLAVDLGVVAVRRGDEPTPAAVAVVVPSPAPVPSSVPSVPARPSAAPTPRPLLELLHALPADRYAYQGHRLVGFADAVRDDAAINGGSVAEVEREYRGYGFRRGSVAVWADTRTRRMVSVRVSEFGTPAGARRFLAANRALAERTSFMAVAAEPSAVPGAVTMWNRTAVRGGYSATVMFVVGRHVHGVSLVGEERYRPEAGLWALATAQYAHARRAGG